MIYDCFTFNNELDILDIRLHELAGLVDRFILVEADQTFKGNPKPLYYDNNKCLFKKFRDKIIHVVCDFPTRPDNLFLKKYNEAWAKQYFQRDQIGSGLASAGADDLIIVSDVDEIFSARKLEYALSVRSKYDLTIFEMGVYFGYLNRRKKGQVWLGPRMIEHSRFSSAQKLRMTKFLGSKSLGDSLVRRAHTRLLNLIRCNIGAPILRIQDAGWHFTSIGGWEDFRVKARSVSTETWMKHNMFQSEKTYMDYVERTTEPVDPSELPIFIQNNPSRFEFLP